MLGSLPEKDMPCWGHCHRRAYRAGVTDLEGHAVLGSLPKKGMRCWSHCLRRGLCVVLYISLPSNA